MLHIEISRVVKHPAFYYVLTTFHGPNTPHFAPFCLFCDFFNNFPWKNKPRKTCQNTAIQRILGGIYIMIKILFVCHGSTAGSRELAALVGQNGANHGNRGGGVLRFYYE